MASLVELEKWKKQASDTALWWERTQAKFGFGMEARATKEANQMVIGFIETFDDLDASYQSIFLSQRGFSDSLEWVNKAQERLAETTTSLTAAEKKRDDLKKQKREMPIIFYNYAK